jgi:hypothetical protein
MYEEQRGPNKNNSVVISRRLFPPILCIGYSSVGLMTDSNHRGLMLILEFTKEAALLGNNISYLLVLVVVAFSHTFLRHVQYTA